MEKGYPVELSEACQALEEDLVALANINNDQDSLNICCALPQKDYGISRSYSENQVYNV